MSLRSFLTILPTTLVAVGAHGQSSDQDQIRQRATHLRAQWQVRVAAGEVSATPTKPAITGGKILTPSVNVTKPPGAPELQLTIDSGTAGVVGGQATLTSPDGKHTVFAQISIPGYPPAPTHYVSNSLLQSPFVTGAFGLYTQPGRWTVGNVLLLSGDGQFISYGNAELHALFHGPAAFTVVNPNPADTEPPAIGHGTIVTPTVSLSAPHPTAAIRLVVSDKLSGVANAYVQLNGPNTANGTTYVSGGAPLKKGVLTTINELQPTTPTGTYTITNVTACDEAGNCSTINTPAGIAAHFTTTTINITK